MSGSAPTAELDRVSKVFRLPPAPWQRLLRRPAPPEIVALRDVSLSIQPGEILGLVGPNGAGKTVLVKLIATLTEPTAGAVRVLGHDSVRGGRAIRAAVGLSTCDERSFYWRLTARQNMEFFARLYGHDRAGAATKVDELLELLDLREIGERPYSVLSAGNRRRLSIARALLPDPQLLLLDEPTASLDPIAARNLRAVVADRLASDPRRAVLFTTHDMAEVEALCSRVAVLHHGELLACDTVDVLRGRYGMTETVTITVAAPIRDATLAGLRGRIPGLTCENGRGELVTLRFARATADDSLNDVITDLVGEGSRIVECRSEVEDLDGLLDRVVAGRPRD